MTSDNDLKSASDEHKHSKQKYEETILCKGEEENCMDSREDSKLT